MSDVKLVLVTVAVLLEAPKNEESRDQRAFAVGDALQEMMTAFASTQTDCNATGVTTFHYPGEEFENAYRCAKCGAWASDFKKPDEVDGIRNGTIVDGQFLCTHCHNHKAA